MSSRASMAWKLHVGWRLQAPDCSSSVSSHCSSGTGDQPDRIVQPRCALKREVGAMATGAQKARLQLYVKAGSDGHCVGDCPFSQRVLMCTRLKAPADQVSISTVDFNNKTQEFLGISPEGKVPVLVDHTNSKVIADSAEINKYLDELFPTPDLHLKYEGPAVEASKGIFPALATLLKTSDTAAHPGLRQNLEAELRKFDTYLQGLPPTESGLPGSSLALGSGQLSDLDCSLLPKLRHVQVAGSHFRGFSIPEELSALHAYIRSGEATPAFSQTCPADKEIICGWSRHNIQKTA